MKREIRAEVLKSLITLSIPTILEEVLATLLQYVDTAMVGHLGEQATAAISVTTTITWLINSIFFAFGVGVLALIARALGSNDKEMIRRVSKQAFLLSIISGAVVGAVCIVLSFRIPVWMGAEEAVRGPAGTYFLIVSIPMIFRSLNGILGAAIRGTKNTKTPMYISAGTNCLNAVLNGILIYGLHLGVTGAAVASAISYTLSGILMFAAYRKSELLYWEWKHVRGDKEVLRECAKISIPVLGTSMVSCFGYVAFAGLVSGMGTTIFAAHSIAVTAETLFYIPGYGLRTATSTLIGISLGEKNQKKFETVSILSVAITVVLMFVSGVLLFFVSHPLMRVFSSSMAVVDMGAEMLKLVAFSEPFFGLMVVMQGIYYGLGRTKYSFAVEAISMWGIRIMFTFLCIHFWGLGLRAVWYCMIADNVCKALLLPLPILSRKRRTAMMCELQ